MHTGRQSPLALFRCQNSHWWSISPRRMHTCTTQRQLLNLTIALSLTWACGMWSVMQIVQAKGLATANPTIHSARHTLTWNTQDASSETTQGDYFKGRIRRRRTRQRANKNGFRRMSCFNRGFSSFLKSGQLSDFVLVGADGSKYRTHKMILAFHSDMFASLFSGEKNNGWTEVESSSFVVSPEVRYLLWCCCCFSYFRGGV